MRATSPHPRGLRAALLSGLCAASLVVGACSGGDKSVVEEISVEAASLDLAPADARALARHFEVAPRSATEADTTALVDGLAFDGLAEDRAVDGSTVVYTDWSATQDDAAMTAKRVTLRGVHESGDGRTTFDAIEIDELRATDYAADEDGTRTQTVEATMDRLVLVGPSADLAQDIVRLLRGEETDARTDPLGELSEDMDFRGLHIDDFEAEVNENGQSGTLEVEQIVVGNDTDAETADLIVEGVSFDWLGANAAGEAQPFTLEMDGMTAIGVDSSADAGLPGAGGMMNLLSSAAPRAKLPYRQVDIGEMTLTSNAFDVDFEGFEADSEEAGSVVTLRSVLSPMRVDIKDAAGTPLAPHMDALRANGLGELVLKGSQTTAFDRKADRMAVSEAKFEIDEGLRMDCDYALQGLGAAAAFVEDSGVSAPDPGALETEEDLDAYLTDLDKFQEVQAEANQRVKIEAVDCTVQDVADNSLVTRGYAVASQVTGKPVLVLKGSAKTMIALGSLTAQSTFKRDLMDTLGSGLIDFMDKPGQTMRVRVAPEAPVAITTLSGPEASLAPLNLSVDVE